MTKRGGRLTVWARVHVLKMEWFVQVYGDSGPLARKVDTRRKVCGDGLTAGAAESTKVDVDWWRSGSAKSAVSVPTTHDVMQQLLAWHGL